MNIRQGFTLIELLVVLSVACVASVMLLGNYNRLHDDWRDRQQVKEASQWLKLYRLAGEHAVAWQLAIATHQDSQLPTSVNSGAQSGHFPAESESEADVDAKAPAERFITLSAVRAESLHELQQRLAALPDNHLSASLLGSSLANVDATTSVDESEPLNRYALVISNGGDSTNSAISGQAIDINARLHAKPYGATTINQATGRYRLHYRVTRAEQLAYLMPARVERQAFSLAEEPK